MKEITTLEVANLLENKDDISIIDVREAGEVAQGMIPGAKNIPLGELEYRLDEVDKTQTHVIVCRSGARSGNATHFLATLGYNASNMVGGMIEWEENLIKN